MPYSRTLRQFPTQASRPVWWYIFHFVRRRKSRKSCNVKVHCCCVKIRSPDLPARSKSLYGLNYPGSERGKY